MSKWHIYTINKLCFKNQWKYQIINLWLNSQYTKSKLVSSEILYEYGRGGWSERLVRFHERRDDVHFCFRFGITVLVRGGRRVELSQRRLQSSRPRDHVPPLHRLMHRHQVILPRMLHSRPLLPPPRQTRAPRGITTYPSIPKWRFPTSMNASATRTKKK